jgi:hypothetical protein
VPSLRTDGGAIGFPRLLSALSRLNGNKPALAYPARLFFLLIAVSLVGLYKEVKCSLKITVTLL